MRPSHHQFRQEPQTSKLAALANAQLREAILAEPIDPEFDEGIEFELSSYRANRYDYY